MSNTLTDEVRALRDEVRTMRLDPDALLDELEIARAEGESPASAIRRVLDEARAGTQETRALLAEIRAEVAALRGGGGTDAPSSTKHVRDLAVIAEALGLPRLKAGDLDVGGMRQRVLDAIGVLRESASREGDDVGPVLAELTAVAETLGVDYPSGPGAGEACVRQARFLVSSMFSITDELEPRDGETTVETVRRTLRDLREANETARADVEEALRDRLDRLVRDLGTVPVAGDSDALYDQVVAAFQAPDRAVAADDANAYAARQDLEGVASELGVHERTEDLGRECRRVVRDMLRALREAKAQPAKPARGAGPRLEAVLAALGMEPDAWRSAKPADLASAAAARVWGPAEMAELHGLRDDLDVPRDLPWLNALHRTRAIVAAGLGIARPDALNLQPEDAIATSRLWPRPLTMTESLELESIRDELDVPGDLSRLDALRAVRAGVNALRKRAGSGNEEYAAGLEKTAREVCDLLGAPTEDDPRYALAHVAEHAVPGLLTDRDRLRATLVALGLFAGTWETASPDQLAEAVHDRLSALERGAEPRLDAVLTALNMPPEAWRSTKPTDLAAAASARVWGEIHRRALEESGYKLDGGETDDFVRGVFSARTSFSGIETFPREDQRAMGQLAAQTEVDAWTRAAFNAAVTTLQPVNFTAYGDGEMAEAPDVLRDLMTMLSDVREWGESARFALLRLWPDAVEACPLKYEEPKRRLAQRSIRTLETLREALGELATNRREGLVGLDAVLASGESLSDVLERLLEDWDEKEKAVKDDEKRSKAETDDDLHEAVARATYETVHGAGEWTTADYVLREDLIRAVREAVPSE
jgi:hypothetical protein